MSVHHLFMFVSFVYICKVWGGGGGLSMKCSSTETKQYIRLFVAVLMKHVLWYPSEIPPCWDVITKRPGVKSKRTPYTGELSSSAQPLTSLW